MAFRALFAAILAVIIYAGYSVWSVEHTYGSMRTAPQNQAAGALPENAGLVLVEFMDYRCPACRAVNPALEKTLAANPDVRAVFRHMPIFQEPSIREARLALAAGKLGKFREMHDLLMARTKPVGESEIEGIAASAGLDPARLRAEMNSRDVSDTLLATLEAGNVLRIGSTPSFMIGRRIYAFRDKVPDENDLNNLIRHARKVR